MSQDNALQSHGLRFTRAAGEQGRSFVWRQYRWQRLSPKVKLLGGIYVTSDFYCDEALSGRTPIQVVMETDDVLAFHHTRPYWAVHIVVVPKVHLPSLTNLGGHSIEIVHRVLDVVRHVAAQVERQEGACRVVTNLGEYQESKHLHFHVAAGDTLNHTDA